MTGQLSEIVKIVSFIKEEIAALKNNNCCDDAYLSQAEIRRNFNINERKWAVISEFSEAPRPIELGFQRRWNKSEVRDFLQSLKVPAGRRNAICVQKNTVV